MPLGTVPPFCTLTVEQLPDRAAAALILEDTLDAWEHTRTLYILRAQGQPTAQVKWSGRPKPNRAGLPEAQMRLRLFDISPAAEVTVTLDVEPVPVSRRAPL